MVLQSTIAKYLNKWDEAIKYYQQQIALASKMPPEAAANLIRECNMDIAACLAKQGKYKEAFAKLDQLIKAGMELECQVMKSEILLTQNKSREALKILDQMHAKYPSQSVVVALAKVMPYSDLKQYQQALKCCDYLLEATPKELQLPILVSKIQCQRAVLLYKLQRYEEAFKAVESALQLLPDSQDIQELKAWLVNTEKDRKSGKSVAAAEPPLNRYIPWVYYG